MHFILSTRARRGFRLICPNSARPLVLSRRTCDTPTRLCAEPRSHARRLGSLPSLEEMSTDPESSLRVLQAYGANSKILTLAYFLFSILIMSSATLVFLLLSRSPHLTGHRPRALQVDIAAARGPDGSLDADAATRAYKQAKLDLGPPRGLGSSSGRHPHFDGGVGSTYLHRQQVALEPR